MFDIGFAELLIVGVVGLIVLGPEKLPTAARSVGLWVGKIRRSLGSIQREINEELRVDELKRSTVMSKQQLDKELSDVTDSFQRPFGDDSPATKAAPEAPKPEFDPAAFTQDSSVIDAYEKAEAGDPDAAVVDNQTDVDKPHETTSSEKSS